MPKEKIEELQTLLANAPDSLKEDAKFVRIEKGTTFIDAGEEATRIYILVKGQVKAADYRVNEVVLSGQERLMYLLTQIYHEHEQEGEDNFRL